MTVGRENSPNRKKHSVELGSGSGGNLSRPVGLYEVYGHSPKGWKGKFPDFKIENSINDE